LRELLYANYRIMYRVEPDRVLLVAVVYAARDWASKEAKPWDVS
jgi:plasmid stabilization system protein ParE